MKGLHSACIVNGQMRSVMMTKIQGFFKWVGISYFLIESQDKNAIKESVLQENMANLDIIVLLNEKGATIYNAPQFEEVVDIDASSKNVAEVIRRIYQYVMDVQSDVVFEKLLSIYEQRNFATELANIKYSIHVYSDDIMQDYRVQEELWKEVVKELEEFEKEDLPKNREYLKHAIVYSKRKINELCNFLSFARIYDTMELLEEARQIWKYDADFSEGEVLQSKIVLSDSKYCLSSNIYLIDGKEKCKVPAIKSFYFYRMGKQQEKMGRMSLSKSSYEEALKLNHFNFRALFMLAVYYIRTQEYKKAERYLLDILSIINPFDILPYFNPKNLTAIELEYVRKCYLLLARISLRMDYGKRFVNYQYERAIKLADTLDDNLYLSEMYPNKEQRDRVIKFLRHEHELKNIKKRI